MDNNIILHKKIYFTCSYCRKKDAVSFRLDDNGYITKVTEEDSTVVLNTSPPVFGNLSRSVGVSDSTFVRYCALTCRKASGSPMIGTTKYPCTPQHVSECWNDFDTEDFVDKIGNVGCGPFSL